jgi:penicillin-binding protein 1B
MDIIPMPSRFARHRVSPYWRTFKIITLATPILLCLFSVYKFWEVDGMVKRRLAVHNHGSFSMAYFRPVRYEAGQPIDPKALRTRLIRREYVETHGAPAREGEFNCNEEGCAVIVRNRGNIETNKDPAVINFRFDDGRITDHKGSIVNEVRLEPLPLSPLGDGEVRALTRLELSEISPHVVNAVLSTEDQRFYSHWGIDPIGILRAIIKNVSAGAWVEGGSTVTQQLAKNVLLSPKRTLSRKFNEVFAALALERHLSKKDILTMYLNEVYFSQEGSIAIHGIQEAAKTFFGRDAKNLTISQSALLIGLIKGPSYYSPRRHLDRSLTRRDVVLQNMMEQGFISSKEFDAAKREKITLSESMFRVRNGAYFMAHLEQELMQNYDMDVDSGAGLQVSTFIDEDFQQCAQEAVAEGLSKLDSTYPRLKGKGKQALQQALVAIDARTGAIVAWVGGRNFQDNQFDHVAQAHRQIGSAIKPFLYLTAMDPSLNTYKVATPVSILGDEPTAITLMDKTTWRPSNYDHKFRGDVTLRYALERSLNAPAVYVAQRVGIKNIKTTLERFNVAREIPEVPALALGALDTSLLELTASFGALSQLGAYVEPRLFDTVSDSEGQLLATRQPIESQVSDPGPVFLVVDILRGVIERGTGTSARAAGFDDPASGKTGTSNESRDAWFIGFTPSLVAGVWTGFDDNRKTGLTGGTASAPTWGKFMKCIEPYLAHDDFSPPPSVSMVNLDARTHKRYSPDCPPPRSSVLREVFLKGTEPRQECYYADDRIERDEPEEEYRDREIQRRPMPHDRRQRDAQSFWDSVWDWG